MKIFVMFALLFTTSVDAGFLDDLRKFLSKANRKYASVKEVPGHKKRLSTIVKRLFCHGGNQRGVDDFTIKALESDDDTLSLLLDSKNDLLGRAKYVPYAVKYKLRMGNKVIANAWEKSLIDQGAHKRLDIDLSQLGAGEYTVDLLIQSKKKSPLFRLSYGTHISHAEVKFERKGLARLSYLGYESDSYDPREITLSFKSEASESQPESGEITITNIETGHEISYVLEKSQLAGAQILVPVFIPTPGEYEIEALLISREGSALSTAVENFNYNLGVASIALSVTPLGNRKYLLDAAGSAPGNYGELTHLSCDLGHSLAGPITIELLSGPKEVWLESPGQWQVECAAWTSMDLDAGYSTVINVQNLLPIGAITKVTPVAGVLRKYLVEVSSSDQDGSVEEGQLIVSGPDGAISSYSTLEAIEISLPLAGPYNLSFVVTDNDGATSEPSVESLVVENMAPVAHITASSTSPFVGDPVALSADGSYDLDGEIVAYKWTYNGATEEGRDYSLQFDSAGPKTISLQVVDNEGKSGSSSVSINVQEQNSGDGSIEIAVAGEEVSPNRFKGEVGMDIGNSDFGEGQFTYSKWDLGDGTVVEGKLFISHAYKEVGSYTIELTLGSEDGETKTTSKTIEIVSLLRTDETPTRYELLMEGIDFKNRNPIQNVVTFKLLGGGEFSNEFNIYLGEDGIEENFELVNGEIVGRFDADEDFNVLYIHAFDQHGNLVKASYSFRAGSKNYNMMVVDTSGDPLPYFSLELQYKNRGAVDSIHVRTDATGRLLLNNLPDVDMLILGSDAESYVNKFISEGNNPTQVVAERVAEPTMPNLDFQNGLAGWSYDPNYVGIVSDGGENKISANVPKGVGTTFSHTFTSSTDGEFITNDVKLGFVSDTHIVQASVINHSAGEARGAVITSPETTARPVVMANLEDVLTLEVKIIPKDETNAFYRKLLNAFSAYADEGVAVVVTIIVDRYNVEIRLLDLDAQLASKTQPRGYRLGQMERLSVGDYVNGVNNLYAHINVGSKPNNLNPLELNVSEAVMVQGSKMLDLVYRPSTLLEVADGAIITREVRHENHSRLDGKHFNTAAILANPNQAADVFVPFLQLPSSGNYFNPYEPIELKIKFQLNRSGVTSDEREYSWSFGSTKILINHDFANHPRHYRHGDNINFVDNGDDWVRPITNTVIAELLEFDPTLEVGDVSNVNGSAPAKVSRYPAQFAPHSWHNDGLRFDVQVSNYRSKEEYLHAGAAYYLTRLVNENKIFRQKLQRKKNSIVAYLMPDDHHKKIYSHSCLMGRTLDQTVDSNWAHRKHFHFKLTEGSDTKWSIADEEGEGGAEGWFRYEGLVQEEDPDTKEIKSVVQYRVYSTVPNLMYQVFYEDENGIFVEKFTVFSDEELGRHTIDDKFVVSFSNDEDPDYGSKINIELITDDLEDLESLENYRVVVSGVDDFNDPEARLNCFAEEFVIGERIVFDCNNDGSEGDVGVINRMNGVVGVNTEIHPDFEVSNGARVCGDTKIETSQGFISGEGVVLEGDNLIGVQCGYFSAASFNKTKLDILNAQFCSDTFGEVIIEADNTGIYPSPIYYDTVLGEEVLNNQKGSTVKNVSINTGLFIARDSVVENVSISNSKSVSIIASQLENMDSIEGIVNVSYSKLSSSRINAKKFHSTLAATHIDSAIITNQSSVNGTFIIASYTTELRRFSSGVLLDAAVINGVGDAGDGLVHVGGSETGAVLIEDSTVSDSAGIYGAEGFNTIIKGQSVIRGHASVNGSKILERSSVEGHVSIGRGSVVKGGAMLSGRVLVTSDVTISDGARVIGPYSENTTYVSGNYSGGTATGVNSINNCTVSMHNKRCENNVLEDYHFD